MPGIEEYLREAFRSLGPKPPEDSDRKTKKRFSELLSQALAHAFAQALRDRGLDGTRPTPPGEEGASGAERRIAGGIGAKKVDVSWATETAGLILGLSVKTINWRDRGTRNFQKNLTNRRGDLLFEAVTLHRRFPYAVLIGVFCLDHEASSDDTDKRRSTFVNAHDRMKLFTGRADPADREEQYERLYIALHNPDPFSPSIVAYEAGDPATPIGWDEIITEVVSLVADRNSDSFEEIDGHLKPV